AEAAVREVLEATARESQTEVALHESARHASGGAARSTGVFSRGSRAVDRRRVCGSGVADLRRGHRRQERGPDVAVAAGRWIVGADVASVLVGPAARFVV